MTNLVVKRVRYDLGKDFILEEMKHWLYHRDLYKTFKWYVLTKVQRKSRKAKQEFICHAKDYYISCGKKIQRRPEYGRKN